MKSSIGIWIDKKKAIIVSLKETESTTKIVESGYDPRERVEGEGKVFGRFGNQFLNNEEKKEVKQETEIKDFIETVVKELSNVESLVIFGPASMKVELKKAIKANRTLAPTLSDVMTADSMTDNQVVAWVKNYFKEKEAVVLD